MPRFIEFCILFVASPIALAQIPPSAYQYVILAFSFLTFWCYYKLRKDRSFDIYRLTKTEGFSKQLRVTLSILLPSTFAVGLILNGFAPEILFKLPKEEFARWLGISACYCLLAAYPQELIYRAYFFHRYRSLFRSGRSRTLMNAVCFGLAHLAFGGWFAVFVAGLIGIALAINYARTHSILQSAVEHALWAFALLSLGVASFFF